MARVMLTASCITQLHVTPTQRVYILRCWSPSYKLILFTCSKSLQIVSGHLELHVKISFTTFAFWFRAYIALTIKRSCQGWRWRTSGPRSLNLGHFLSSQTSCNMWIKMRGLDWLQNLSHDGVVEGRGLFGAEDLDESQFGWQGAKDSWGLISRPLFPGCTAHVPLHKHLSPQNSSRAHICLHEASWAWRCTWNFGDQRLSTPWVIT